MAIEEINDSFNTVYEPQHYKTADVETIEIIEQLTKDYEPEEAYIAGNIIKYLARANHKGTKQDDLAKLANYAHRLAHGEWLGTVEEESSTLEYLRLKIKILRKFMRMAHEADFVSENYMRGQVDAYTNILKSLGDEEQ